MDNRELLQEITQRIDSSARETREYVDASTRGVRSDFARAVVDLTNAYKAVAESQDHHIDIISEGHEMLAATIGRVAAELRQEMSVQGEMLRTEMRAGDEKLRIEVRAGDAALREELTAFRSEVRGEFAEVRRVARVESAVSELSARVGRLEDRAGA
jgi:hypothetical protein